MTIRIWNAFSCNNSGSFRLVARFADTAAAREAAAAFTELRDQLAETVSDAPNARVTILEAIARHHELTFDDEGWYGSESGPHVTVDDNVLIAHHDYCLGLGPGIPEFLARRGAKVEQERWTSRSRCCSAPRPVSIHDSIAISTI